MDRVRRLEAFVQSLVEAALPPGFRNPYASPEAAHNLTLFLRARDPGVAAVLLIGEAPGYRGAAISGVALSSMEILIEPWEDPWSSFGPEAGYRVPPETRYYREATATMVWEILATHLGMRPLPLTWNAVPFHPWRLNAASNAPLHRRSVALGRKWIEELLELFPNAVPAAVGVRAGEALSSLGISHSALRHPSRGGKQMFALGVKRIAALVG